MSEVKVNKISPRSGTTVTLGDSGDTIAVASGASLSGFTSTGIDDNATSTAITITNTEDIGIGVVSPNAKFHIHGPDQTTANIDTSSNIVLNVAGTGGSINNGGSVVFSANDGAWKFAAIKGLVSDGTSNTRGDLAFSVRNTNTDSTLSEAMRIDSSGNVLVGTTDVTIGYSDGDVGIALEGANGYIGIARSPSASTQALAYLNRLNSDGDIVQFRKDGATVGSIDTISSNLTITPTNDLVFTNGDGDAIGFHRDDSFRPRTNDATHDFGTSSKRWRNLYLSGNIYLGGTGSANALDDYETGTWSVVLTPSTSGSITLKASANLFSYTKIGDIVFFTGRIQVDSVASPVGSLTLAGLPFTSANLDDTAGITHFPMFTYGVNLASPISTMLEVAEGATNGGVLQQQDDAGWGALDASGVSANDFFTINGSYRVA